MSSSDSSHKLWGGRFAGGPAPELEAVNRSIGTDIRLWPFDVRLSQAWADGLASAGVYGPEEAREVRDGLARVAVKARLIMKPWS